MREAIAIPVVGLLPVLIFLFVLVRMDSYKLTGLRVVLAVVGGGALCGLAAYVFNGLAMQATGLGVATYSRTLAPLVEESIKGLVIVWLFRTHRIGMPIDAAILGFAVGAGFALVENAAYMALASNLALGTWIVRGLGTALMHGGATAILAVLAVVAAETDSKWGRLRYLPALLLAVLVHAAYNQFFLSPIATALVTIGTLPLLLFETFQRGQKKLGDWLGSGFDADANMMELLESGQLAGSPLGNYLESLTHRFDGMVVADILSYVRIHTELALRAKGLLMMRENGMDLPMDDETRARFAELEYLEQSIGATGLLAIRPMLHTTRQDLWQLSVLGS